MFDVGLGLGKIPDVSLVYILYALNSIPNNVFKTNVVTFGVVMVALYFHNVAIFSGLNRK